MINFKFFANDKDLTDKFSKYSTITGILFLIIGVLSIFYPVFASITTALFFGWLLLFSGFLIAFNTFKTNKKDWYGWLKSVILIGVGALTVLNPLAGIAAVGMLFAFYFLMDSFASVALALELKPDKSWLLVFINGLTSFLLAIILLINWPFSSLWMVGLIVGISLFFDGIVLLTLAKAAKKSNK